MLFVGPPEEIYVPPMIGAVVGGVGAIVILIISGLILSRYVPRCYRPSDEQSSVGDQITVSPKGSIDSKSRDVTTLTNISSSMICKEGSMESGSSVQQGDSTKFELCSMASRVQKSGNSGCSALQNTTIGEDFCQQGRSDIIVATCEKNDYNEGEDTTRENQLSMIYREKRTNISRGGGKDRFSPGLRNNPDLVRGTTG